MTESCWIMYHNYATTISQLFFILHNMIHEFTLTYNKLSKGLCVFGALSEERSPSSEIIPSPGYSPRPGRGVWALHLARTQNAPPSAPPRAGVETGWRWGVGVVEGRWKTRGNEGKTALIIYRDSLSCWLDRWRDYWWWIGRVNYLCVLLPKFVNKTSLMRHFFTKFNLIHLFN